MICQRGNIYRLLEKSPAPPNYKKNSIWFNFPGDSLAFVLKKFLNQAFAGGSTKDAANVPWPGFTGKRTAGA